MDFFQRENACLEDVKFLLKNYPTVLRTTARETHLLQEEFVEYHRLLSNEDIPKKVWDEAQIKLSNEENEEKSLSSFRMDVIWGSLTLLKLGNGSHKFGRISDVAKTVLILPPSNAGEERSFFSYWKKQNSFSAFSSGWRYTSLSAYSQNGQQRVIIWTTYRSVKQCQESYLQL